jgi:CRISPR-associated exonuclease Cas4
MEINATLVNLYNVCKRELWLHAICVRFEQTSDLVYDGKLIHESSYPLRSSKYEEVEIDGIKVDYYDTKSKTIHEIKKSNKVEKAHEWQLKYYMYVFEQHGVIDVKGILEYPTLRKTQAVVLSDVDRDRIKEMVTDIEGIITSDDCPPLQKKGICKNCSYYEFCYTKEDDE